MQTRSQTRRNRWKHRIHIGVVALSAVAFLQGPAIAAAITTSWTGGPVGNWSTGGSWDFGTPNNGGGNTYTTIIDNMGGQNTTVNLDINATIDNLTVDANDQLNITNLRTLTFTNSGTISNANAINVSSLGNLTELLMDGNVTLNGGGTVTMSGHTNVRIRGNGGLNDKLTTNNTIQGLGQIGANLMALENSGSIHANSNGNSLTIDVDTQAGSTNTGTFKASNGGTLVVQGSIINNAGGTVRAETGSEVHLNTSTIAGGTFETDGTGLIRATGAVTLDGVGLTNAGTYHLNNNTTTTLKGAITNTGAFNVASLGNLTELLMDGNVTLDGGGTVTMSGSNNARIRGDGAGDELINVDNTIQGRGQLGVNLMALTNQAGGTIHANDVGALTVDVQGTTFNNGGTLKASGAGVLNLSDQTVNSTGALIAENGSKIDLTAALSVYNQTAGPGRGHPGGRRPELYKRFPLGVGQRQRHCRIRRGVHHQRRIFAGHPQLQQQFDVCRADRELGGLLVDGLAPNAGIVNQGANPTTTQFDQLNVFDGFDGTTTTLDVTTLSFDLNVLGGFGSIQVGDFFDVFTADTFAFSGGGIGDINTMFHNGFVFDLTHFVGGNREALRLTVTTVGTVGQEVPEPSTVVLLLTGLVGAAILRRRM